MIVASNFQHELRAYINLQIKLFCRGGLIKHGNI